MPPRNNLFPKSPTQQTVSRRTFSPSLADRPMHLYGRRRNYVYYPYRWSDPVTGRVYETGYYDDTGVRYENVAFQEDDGKYHNVLSQCPYCGTQKILNMDAKAVAQFDLKCEGCGAQMEIVSELDDLLDARDDIAGSSSVSDSSYSGSSHGRLSYDPDVTKTNKNKKKKSSSKLAVWLFMAGALIATGRYMAHKAETEPIVDIPNLQQIEIQEVVDNVKIKPGVPVYLERQSDGNFHVVTDVIRSDKILYWDASADSWYDDATDCWLWYNTDVEPAVWQYWVEGISSDYGDYGWMEHDETGWYIEKANGNWIPVPAIYNTDNLWYIESGK